MLDISLVLFCASAFVREFYSSVRKYMLKSAYGTGMMGQ